MVDTVTMWIEAIMGTEWVYPIVGLLIFGDCFFPVLPSEIPLNMAGAWAGSQGPGEITIPSGSIAKASSTLSASLRRTTTSAPASAR